MPVLSDKAFVSTSSCANTRSTALTFRMIDIKIRLERKSLEKGCYEASKYFRSGLVGKVALALIRKNFPG